MSFNKLNSFLSNCTKEKRIPGCVCWVGNKKETLFFGNYGYAQVVPNRREMTKDTVFDLASLTKPIVTAFSIMLLQEQEMLQLNSPVGALLPSLKKSALANKIIEQLLTHVSGLPAWYPTYIYAKETRLSNIANLCTDNAKVVYSCLGYILLGKIIEHITQMSLAEFFHEHIAQKLSLGTMGFGPVTHIGNVASTEKGNVHEQEIAAQHGDISNFNWRKDLIQGEVHDGNAFYGFDSVAGNAGLFSNTEDLAKLSQAYLTGEIVSKTTLAMMTKDYTGGAEKRGIGWKMDMYPGLLSPNSLGHTGFTGTMLVIDPLRELIIILLANAVHPRVKLGLMNPIRHEAVRLITDTIRTK